eukprot:s2569_g6.t2
MIIDSEIRKLKEELTKTKKELLEAQAGAEAASKKAEDTSRGASGSRLEIEVLDVNVEAFWTDESNLATKRAEREKREAIAEAERLDALEDEQQRADLEAEKEQARKEQEEKAQKQAEEHEAETHGGRDYTAAAPQFEVLVRSMGGSTFNYQMDKNAIVGDLKQRISNQTRVKYHEIRLIHQQVTQAGHQNVEPDTFDKLHRLLPSTRAGPLEIQLVVTASCRWCNARLEQLPTLETEIGEYCSQRCYDLMRRQLADPNSVFTVFGITADTQPRQRDPQQQLPPQYAPQMGYDAPWETEKNQKKARDIADQMEKEYTNSLLSGVWEAWEHAFRQGSAEHKKAEAKAEIERLRKEELLKGEVSKAQIADQMYAQYCRELLDGVFELWRDAFKEEKGKKAADAARLKMEQDFGNMNDVTTGIHPEMHRFKQAEHDKAFNTAKQIAEQMYKKYCNGLFDEIVAVWKEETMKTKKEKEERTKKAQEEGRIKAQQEKDLREAEVLAERMRKTLQNDDVKFCFDFWVSDYRAEGQRRRDEEAKKKHEAELAALKRMEQETGERAALQIAQKRLGCLQGQPMYKKIVDDNMLLDPNSSVGADELDRIRREELEKKDKAAQKLAEQMFKKYWDDTWRPESLLQGDNIGVVVELWRRLAVLTKETKARRQHEEELARLKRSHKEVGTKAALEIAGRMSKAHCDSLLKMSISSWRVWTHQTQSSRKEEEAKKKYEQEMHAARLDMARIRRLEVEKADKAAEVAGLNMFRKVMNDNLGLIEARAKGERVRHLVAQNLLAKDKKEVLSDAFAKWVINWRRYVIQDREGLFRAYRRWDVKLSWQCQRHLSARSPIPLRRSFPKAMAGSEPFDHEVFSEFSLVTEAGPGPQGLQGPQSESVKEWLPDPFLAMNLGEEMQSQYLSDAMQRLKNPELWESAAAAEIRQLSSNADPEVRVKLDELSHKYQEVAVQKLRSLRGNIMAMAHILVELLAARDYDQKMRQECQDELKDAIEKIQSIFVTQQEDYKAHSEIHFQRVVSLFQDSQKDSWKSALGAMSAVVGAMVPAYILRLVWLTLFRPKRMEKTDILRQWYKPVYRDLNGNMHYKLMRNKEGGLRLRAGWLLSLLVGGSSAAILLCGRAVLSAYWHAQSSKQKNVMAKAESLVKVEMQQLQSMWQGTQMAVDAVRDTADRLESSAESRRTEHRQRLTRQMLQELWTMSMAVDEMIVWMSQRECFPHNYSVRNMVTPARYDKILGAFKQVTDNVKQSAAGGA